jgi:hypothetical protein
MGGLVLLHNFLNYKVMTEMTIQRMTSAPIVIEIVDTSVTPEAPYNLTGKTVMLTVKTREDVADNDETALIRHQITEHTDAINGLTGFVPTEDEQQIPAGSYIADICVFDGDGLKLNSDRINLSVIDVTGKTIA